MKLLSTCREIDPTTLEPYVRVVVRIPMTQCLSHDTDVSVTYEKLGTTFANLLKVTNIDHRIDNIPSDGA